VLLRVVDVPGALDFFPKTSPGSQNEFTHCASRNCVEFFIVSPPSCFHRFTTFRFVPPRKSPNDSRSFKVTLVCHFLSLIFFSALRSGKHFNHEPASLFPLRGGYYFCAFLLDPYTVRPLLFLFPFKLVVFLAPRPTRLPLTPVVIASKVTVSFPVLKTDIFHFRCLCFLINDSSLPCLFFRAFFDLAVELSKQIPTVLSLKI